MQNKTELKTIYVTLHKTLMLLCRPWLQGSRFASAHCIIVALVIVRGVHMGGSGRKLRPVWLRGGEEFPPQGGKNSPDIWVIVWPIYLGILPPWGWSYVIYKSFLAQGSHLQLGVPGPYSSDIRSFVRHCMVHPYLLVKYFTSLHSC